MAAQRSDNAEQIEERREIAFALRRAGDSFRTISRKLTELAARASKPYLEVGSSQAERDVKAVLRRIVRETNKSAEELVALEVARLDLALGALAQQVKNGNHGAIDRWLKIAERRAKLLGLDKPVEQRHEITGAGGTPLITEVIVRKHAREEPVE